MSRREGRESDSKRHRSKFDREPSPKRYRRDGKPAAERRPSNFDTDAGNHVGRDQKHRRRLQDALPLEDPLPPDSKKEERAVNKESDKKTNGHSEGTRPSSDPTEAPRPCSYYKHDERGSAGQAGRSFVRRSTTDRGWLRDSRDQRGAGVSSKLASHDTQRRDDKPQTLGEENHVWRHDGFYELEKKGTESGLPPPPVRKRPAFRETKVPVEAENVDKATTEPIKLSNLGRPTLGSERREEREGRNPHSFGRSERPFARDRPLPNRERYGGGNGRFKEGDRFNGRHGARSSGAHVEKWKHDMFNEANRSPTPKNEEDQIAKVEALLAS